MTLGNRIKVARKRLRMSQAVLARHTKVDQSSIAYWESGRTSPKYSRLLELATFLEVTPEWLQFGINSGSSNKTIPLVAAIGLSGTTPAWAETVSQESVDLGMGLLCEDCIAISIHGNALAPAYMDGDILIGERQNLQIMTDEISTDCVIGMKDGRTLLARAPAGRNGPHNPITNPANVAWVMQVTWIRRGPVKSQPSEEAIAPCALQSEETVSNHEQPQQIAAQ